MINLIILHRQRHHTALCSMLAAFSFATCFSQTASTVVTIPDSQVKHCADDAWQWLSLSWPQKALAGAEIRASHVVCSTWEHAVLLICLTAVWRP